MLDVSGMVYWVIMQTSARMARSQMGMIIMTPLPRCVMRTVKKRNMRMGKTKKQESKNPEDDEKEMDPGTAKSTENPQGAPLTHLYVHNIL